MEVPPRRSNRQRYVSAVLLRDVTPVRGLLPRIAIDSNVQPDANTDNEGTDDDLSSLSGKIGFLILEFIKNKCLDI